MIRIHMADGKHVELDIAFKEVSEAMDKASPETRFLTFIDMGVSVNLEQVILIEETK